MVFIKTSKTQLKTVWKSWGFPDAMRTQFGSLPRKLVSDAPYPWRSLYIPALRSSKNTRRYDQAAFPDGSTLHYCRHRRSSGDFYSQVLRSAMMESLPIDTSHPAVRDYLALIRLQVLTPLSLLINIATVIVCSVVLHPGLSQISELYPSSIAPDPSLIAIYITAIYIGQIGYCVLLVFARKQETKAALVRGVGLPLVIANWVMAGWAIAWVLQAFLLSTVLLGILLVLLTYANIVLLVYHAPSTKRPFDIALIHAPMRAFLLWPLMVMFPYSLFVTLGFTWSPGEPQHYARHQWAGFGVTLGVNLLGLVVIVLRRDIVWCIAASWMCATIWIRAPKPMPVWLTAVLFTIAHPLALVASMLWVHLRGRRGGAITLPPDEDGDASGRTQDQGRGPREVDVDALWG